MPIIKYLFNTASLVKKYLSEEELVGLIKREGDKRLLKRLTFIRSLYNGEVVEKAVKRLRRCKTNGYLWLNSGTMEFSRG